MKRFFSSYPCSDHFLNDSLNLGNWPKLPFFGSYDIDKNRLQAIRKTLRFAF